MSDDAEGFRAETLHVEARHDDGGATIVVVGEFVMTGTESFWAHVSEALETQPVSITVEARGLTFIDSSGLAALMRAREAADEAGAASCQRTVASAAAHSGDHWHRGAAPRRVTTNRLVELAVLLGGRHVQCGRVPEGDLPDGRESRRSELLHVEVWGDREAVIAVDGELDVSDTQWFTAHVSEALENDPASLAIDAGRLTYLDSSGLRSLLLARAAAIQAGVAFYVSEASPMRRHLAERPGSGGCSWTIDNQRRPRGERGVPQGPAGN